MLSEPQSSTILRRTLFCSKSQIMKPRDTTKQSASKYLTYGGENYSIQNPTYLMAGPRRKPSRKQKIYEITRQKYLNKEEYERLRRLLKAVMHKEPRNCILIDIALSTGARASEILALRAEDVNYQDQALFFRGLKGSRDRELPIRPDLFKNIEKHLPKKGALFDIGYQRLYQIWGEYRPAPKTFHSLRHTFAINLYEKTRDLRLIKAALGHKNVSNTMIYADWFYSVAEFRRLIE